MPKILTVAVIQMCPKPYNLEQNLALALNLCKKAHKKGANLMVLPELFDSGYCVSDRDSEFGLDFSKPKKSATFRALSDFAKSSGSYIVACGIEKDSAKDSAKKGKKTLYDTAYIITPQGKLLGKHRKIYLWDKEKSRFCSGDKYEVFTLDFGSKNSSKNAQSVKIGLQICYEIGFGVSANILALKGAEILIYPSAFGKARAYNWDLLSKARALENGCFVLACNHSGAESFAKSLTDSNKAIKSRQKDKLDFAGDSRIISPQGKIIKRARKRNEVIIASLDLSQVKSQRKAVPYLKDFDTKLTKRSFGKFT